MKKITKIVAVMAVLSTVFIGCKKPDDPVDPKPAEKTDNSEPAAPETPADEEPTDPADEETTPTVLAVVFEGSTELAWAGDENAIVIPHDEFSEEVVGIKITYTTGAEAAFKVAVCDPWEEIKFAKEAVSSGDVADDGAIIPGPNQTTAQSITLKIDSATLRKIIGEGKAGAWGGIKIFGGSVTVSKVETLK